MPEETFESIQAVVYISYLLEAVDETSDFFTQEVKDNQTDIPDIVREQFIFVIDLKGFV